MTTYPYNVNQTLLEYLLDPQSEFHAKYFANPRGYHSETEIEQFSRDLVDFLTGKLDEKRATIALDLILFILTDNDMDDFTEIIKYLTRKEFAGDFYKKYRDHTIHQLLVFFLGCFFYERVPAFKGLYQAQHDREFPEDPHPDINGFFFQWSCIALFHDFGYFFDIEQPLGSGGDVADEDIELSAKKRATLHAFFRHVENYFNHYLETVYRLQKGEPNDRKKRSIQELQVQLGLGSFSFVYRNHLDTLLLSDLRFAQGFLGDTCDGFELIDRLAAELYPKFAGLLRPYFDLLNHEGAPYGEQYVRVWDHGIASALLFVSLCCLGFKVYTEMTDSEQLFRELEGAQKETANEFRDFIALWDYSRPVFDRLIVSIGLAIALHNIRPLDSSVHYAQERYNHRSVELMRRVREEVLPITPDDNFLAYLILVTDQLQDWDRYNILKVGDERGRHTLESHQIGLAVHADRCVITFFGPEWVRERAQQIENDIDLLTSSKERVFEIIYEDDHDVVSKLSQQHR